MTGIHKDDRKNSPTPKLKSTTTIDFSQNEDYWTKTSTLGSTTLETKPSNNEINTQMKISSDPSSAFGSSFAATKTSKSVASSGITQLFQMTTKGTSSDANPQHEINIEDKKSTPLATGRSTIKGYRYSFEAKSTISDIKTATASYETTGEGIIVFFLMYIL